MILGVTGHRPPILFGGYNPDKDRYEKMKNFVSNKIIELNPDKIISGMAQGVDQIVAEIAVETGIPFIAAIPCDGQDATWPDEAKKRYMDLLEKASESVVVSPGPYEAKKMHIRDKWIVENSTCLLGVWNGQRYGGTFSTIRSAEKLIAKGREYQIHIINPEELNINN